jgi:ATP-dependent DNA ligase
LGPTACRRFDELRSREARHAAILYAFDLIEYDREDMRNRPFLDRKAALARLLRETEAGILLNEHIPEDGATVFAHACRLGAEGIVSKKVDSTCRSGRAVSGSGSAIPPAPPCSRRGASFGVNEPEAPAPRWTVAHSAS